MISVIALIGVAAFAASLWRRQWADATLVAIAAIALALLNHQFVLPAGAGRTLMVDPANPPTSINGVSVLRVDHAGLRAAQWNDLPARPVVYRLPTAPDHVNLDFPRQISRGRMFSLTVQGYMDAPGTALRLFEENGQLLAKLTGNVYTVDWLPPVAERVVLTARLVDPVSERVLDQGHVPVNVVDNQPLRVQGRFAAPSFDLHALDKLLTGSNALLDWKITLGKAVTREETAEAKFERPDLLLIDAAWFEHATPTERNALLTQVAQGTPLLVLGSNAADAGVWPRTLQLQLGPQPENKKAEVPLEMMVAPLNPASPHAGEWTMESNSMLWTRRWYGGRIGWLGVGGWHHHAITDPKQLALWWQKTLDDLGVEHAQDVEWLDPEEMPLPGQRLELCARGVHGQVEIPELHQSFGWQRRPERVDASCVAVWPTKPGWLTLRTEGSKPAISSVYVFSPDDWPLWQATQRRRATERYMARTPVQAGGVPQPLPRWPFALLFALAMLALWWRERRGGPPRDK